MIFLKNKFTLLILLIIFIMPIISINAAPIIDNTYTPIEGVPGITKVSLKDPGDYFANLFQIFIIIASILGVIKLMYHGIQYMGTGSVTKKSEAISGIRDVLMGLAIILLSVVALNIINKDLTELNFGVIRTDIETVTQ